MACEEMHGAFTLTCSSGPDRPAGRRPRWRPACASTSGAAVRPGAMDVPAVVCALL